MKALPATSFAFDTLAADYDATFTQSVVGGLMRRAVWRRLDARFCAGDRVLELNCGTGEDAVYLGRRGVRVFATDLSHQMVETARRKVGQAVLDDTITVRQLDLRCLDQVHEEPFDGVLSNFGGLNCVGELKPVARALASKVRHGAVAVLCLMGQFVPWEWFWCLGRGQPNKAFRRLRHGGVPWRGMTIYYPSIGRLRRAFSPEFRLLRSSAVGAIIPPSYAESWAAWHPRLVRFMARCERRLETLPPLPSIADHYLLELERV